MSVVPVSPSFGGFFYYNGLLGYLADKSNFYYLLQDCFVTLYKSLVRSHLEYANCVWSPHHQKLIKKIEKVQMRATKLLSSTRNLKYEERLKILNLPTLKYRRVRGDMIELYKIITCTQDNAVTLKFNTIPAPVTRGNTYKIRQYHVRYDLRKFSFSNSQNAME